MSEVKLHLRYPDSKPEDITDAYMRGVEVGRTLGAGTCRQEEHGWSTEGDHARVWLTCGHDCMVETVADLPNYCPICGAEVMHA